MIDNTKAIVGVTYNGDPVPMVGGDISLDIEGATVGQIVEIATVDHNGKPTSWKPACMPKQFGDSWRKFAEITTQIETSIINVTEDYNGNAFEFTEVYGLIELKPAETKTQCTYLKPRVGAASNDITTVCGNITGFSASSKYVHFLVTLVPLANCYVASRVEANTYNWGMNLPSAMSPYYDGRIWNMDKIRAIQISCNDGSSDHTIGGVGTKITLFGR